MSLIQPGVIRPMRFVRRSKDCLGYKASTHDGKVNHREDGLDAVALGTACL